jgi:hypothetical protein
MSKLIPCEHENCIWLPFIKKYTNIDFVPSELCKNLFEVNEKFRRRDSFNFLTNLTSFHRSFNQSLRDVEILSFSVKTECLEKFKRNEYSKDIIIKLMKCFEKLTGTTSLRKKLNNRIDQFLRLIKSYRRDDGNYQEQEENNQITKEFVVLEVSNIFKSFMSLLNESVCFVNNFKNMYIDRTDVFDPIFKSINDFMEKFDAKLNDIANISNEINSNPVPHITRNENFPRIRERDSFEWYPDTEPRDLTLKELPYKLINPIEYTQQCIHPDCAWRKVWEIFTDIFDRCNSYKYDVPNEICESLRLISKDHNEKKWNEKCCS